VLVAAAVTYQFDLGERLGLAHSDSPSEPAQVSPPPGLDLPVQGSAPVVAGPVAPGNADPASVARAVRRLVGDDSLGRRVAVAIAEAGSGQTVYAAGERVAIPASTMKLLTTLAVLEAWGPDHRFTTETVRKGRRLVLVGGGDPLLTREPGEADAYPRGADLVTLARRTALALSRAGVTKVSLGYDTSLFAGPAVEPTWEADYVEDDVVSPITSLWVDEGRVVPGQAERSADPALAAADLFAAALREEGLSVVGRPSVTVAKAGSMPVASVEGPPLAEVVQHVLELSDNEGAEVLARQVAVAQGSEASFDGASAAVADVLSGLGVRMRGAVIEDGSGLSRADRLNRDTLLDVLDVAGADPELRTVVTGLPVAGFTGSLALRFDTAPRIALGEVRAKTGTLSGVSGLAGTTVTRDGVVLRFVAIADRVRRADTMDARATLDEIAGALAACVCA
jgi:D-alanyl-D-alanine carboxypeptidase/D-alanyl-D-alanine-endopeptidase (penicillin-binding protein 4)